MNAVRAWFGSTTGLSAAILVMTMVLSGGGSAAGSEAVSSEPGVQQVASFGAGVDRTNDAQPQNASEARNAATVTRRSRASGYHDFLRIVWVPSGLKVTTLGKPTAKRVFVTAASFLDPPATVDEVVNFVGNYYHYNQDFAVMVCRPPIAERAKTEPKLATWPNVLPIIKKDLGDCAAGTLTPGEREICTVAERYRDRKFDIYARGLRRTLNVASQLFETTESQNALWDDFGIATAFSGLGFTVWGSSTPSTTVRMTTAAILQHSVVPEYLLKNVTLQDANCRCVQVPESEPLHTAPVDPAAIWAAGQLDGGACRQLPALPE